MIFPTTTSSFRKGQDPTFIEMIRCKQRLPNDPWSPFLDFWTFLHGQWRRKRRGRLLAKSLLQEAVQPDRLEECENVWSVTTQVGWFVAQSVAACLVQRKTGGLGVWCGIEHWTFVFNPDLQSKRRCSGRDIANLTCKNTNWKALAKIQKKIWEINYGESGCGWLY